MMRPGYEGNMTRQEATQRYEIINPRRWFSHWITITLMIVVPALWVPLVWFKSVKDRSPESAAGFFGFFVAFGVVWAFTLVWSRRAYRSPDKNYVEVLPDELRFCWAGKVQAVKRSEVTACRVKRRRWLPEGAYNAFSQWAPAGEHVELTLRKPVWFKYLSTTGQWRADFIPLEVRDLKGFKSVLDGWLGEAPRGD
jgi:hypothetical protein